MFEAGFGTILAWITVCVLPFLFVVNYFYRKRADDFADNLLKEIPEEYNRQIKANAYRYLITNCIWGLFFLSGFIFNYHEVIAQGFNLLTISFTTVGISFILWGFWRYQKELAKLKVMK